MTAPWKDNAPGCPCCGAAGVCPCPTPDILRLVDPVFGEIDLTHYPEYGGWLGCRQVTHPGISRCRFGEEENVYAEVSTRLVYKLTCLPGGYRLTIWYWGCVPPGVDSDGNPNGDCSNGNNFPSRIPMSAACGDPPYLSGPGNSPGAGPSEIADCPDSGGGNILGFDGVALLATGCVVCDPLKIDMRGADRSHHGLIVPVELGHLLGDPLSTSFWGGFDVGFIVYDPASFGAAPEPFCPPPTCCDGPELPDDLYLTDPVGTVPLTLDPTFTPYKLWRGSRTVNITAGIPGEGALQQTCEGTTPGTDVTVRYTFGCPYGDGKYYFTYTLPICSGEEGVLPVGSFDGTFVTGEQWQDECKSCDMPFYAAFRVDVIFGFDAVWGVPSSAASGYYPQFFVSSIDPLPTTSQACITVRRGCVETGELVEGAIVEVAGVGTCTTGPDGKCCFAVAFAAAYVATISDGDCEVTRRFSVGPCGGNVEFDVALCCATACLRVTDVGTGDPIEGATVSLPGHDDVTTGPDGLACFNLTTAEMLAFAVAGADCSVRSVGPFTISSPVGEDGDLYLSRCEVYADTDCGADGSTASDVSLSPYPAGFIEPAEGVPSCCGPADCTAPGPAGRGLAPLAISGDLGYEILSGGGGGLAGFGPRTWAGTLALDVSEFLATGKQRYTSDCIDIPDHVYLDTEGEVCVTWRAMRAELELCRGEGLPGRLRVYLLVDAACDDGPGTIECPDCSGHDLIIELPMDANSAMGAQTHRLCYGEFVDAHTTNEGPSCFAVASFAAVAA